MQKQGPSAFRIALIVLGTIYLTLFILVGIAWLFTTNLTNVFLVIVGISAIFVAYSMYTTLKKRQWTVFAIIAIIVGVLILTSSTLAIVPYSTSWTYETQYSDNLFNETVLMQPNETRSFQHDFWGYFWALNSSLFQVRISSSNKLSMQMYAAPSSEGAFNEQNLALNATGFFGQLGWSWRSYYWAPAGPLWQDGPNIGSWDNISDVRFVGLFLTNLDSSNATAYLQLDVFYKGDAQRLTTNYRPLIDTRFASVGMALIASAVVIEAYPLIKMRRNSARNGSAEHEQNTSATEHT